MKIRFGFISNSSSTSFIIVNKTDENKTLEDFVIESKYLLDDFNKQYDRCYTVKDLLKALPFYKEYIWKPKEKKICIFGDEDGNVLGETYDYMLKDGGNTESFNWKYHESLR